MALIFLEKSLRAARFFVIYFTSVATGIEWRSQKKSAKKK